MVGPQVALLEHGKHTTQSLASHLPKRRCECVQEFLCCYLHTSPVTIISLKTLEHAQPLRPNERVREGFKFSVQAGALATESWHVSPWLSTTQRERETTYSTHHTVHFPSASMCAPVQFHRISSALRMRASSFGAAALRGVGESGPKCKSVCDFCFS